jgi:hypothetical protein
MKVLSYILGLLITSCVFISCDDDDDVAIQRSDLPKTAQTFLDTHFPGAEMSWGERDNDSYDVVLSNGFEIDFLLTGEWDDVDGRSQAIPQTILDLIPASIIQYVDVNYTGRIIVEINKEGYGYEIGLKDGLDLKFDTTGKFLAEDRD